MKKNKTLLFFGTFGDKPCTNMVQGKPQCLPLGNQGLKPEGLISRRDESGNKRLVARSVNPEGEQYRKPLTSKMSRAIGVFRRADHKRSGFTLVEMIMTIVVLGMIMIPLGIMSIEYVQAIAYSRALEVAEGLAKTEMSKINNLAYDDDSLADGYDNTASNYEGYPYDLRRTVNYVSGWNSNLKQAQVRVYPSGEPLNHLINVITYVGNVSFGAGSGGAGGGGGQADSLSIGGGIIDRTKLKRIKMSNIGDVQIVITKVKITFTGQGGIQLKKIKMDGNTMWQGKGNSGDVITLDVTFRMDAGTSYGKNSFVFTKNVFSVTVDYYEFEDASRAGPYSWQIIP